MSEDFSQSIVSGESETDLRKEVILAGFNSLPQKSKKLKIIFVILGLFFIFISIIAAVYLVRQRQEIRKEAVEQRLVCMPIDEAGNIINEKYRYDRMKVINQTDKEIQIKVQENFCPYEGIEPQTLYRCDQFAKAYPLKIIPGEERIIKMDVPCQKIGQLDISKDKDHYQHIGVNPNTIPDCFNTTDGRIWEGGIAFTLKSNPSPCCPEISLSVNPSNPKSGEIITIDAYSPQVLTCVEITSIEGISGGLTNFRVEGKYHWRWDAKTGSQPGSYNIIFRGNIEDSGVGDCPQRAIGEWCQATTTYTIGTVPTSTPTPTPPPEVSCWWIKAYNINWQELSSSQLRNLRPGDKVYFVVAGSGLGIFDRARFRINNEEWQETAVKRPGTQEFYISYTIPSEITDFKIEAEIHHQTQGWK